MKTKSYKAILFTGLLCTSQMTAGTSTPPAFIYDNVPSSAVLPQNGLWKLEMISHKERGCPPGMKPSESQSGFKKKSKQITFSKPFHPTMLFDEAKEYQWKEVAPNQWKTVVIDKSEEGMKLQIQIVMVLNTEKKISVWSNTGMTFPAEMASMLGGSNECSVQYYGTYTFDESLDQKEEK